MKELLAARVSGKAKASSGSSAPPPKKPQQQQNSGGGKTGSGAPVTLTAANFESEVLQSKSIWLVEVTHTLVHTSFAPHSFTVSVHGPLVWPLQEPEARVGQCCPASRR
jgi:hypothetical protein